MCIYNVLDRLTTSSIICCYVIGRFFQRHILHSFRASTLPSLPQNNFEHAVICKLRKPSYLIRIRMTTFCCFRRTARFGMTLIQPHQLQRNLIHIDLVVLIRIGAPARQRHVPIRRGRDQLTMPCGSTTCFPAHQGCRFEGPAAVRTRSRACRCRRRRKCRRSCSCSWISGT